MDKLACLLSFVGIYLNARKRIACWPVWLAASLLWVAYFAPKGEWASVVMWGGYAAFNCYGWYAWTKE